MVGFFKVGQVSDFPVGRGKAVKIEGERVAVFNVDGKLMALQDACPHMGASLGDYGTLENGRVVCTWHGWSFDLATGQGDQRKWACARVFEVRVRGQDVWVKPPPKQEPAPPPPEEDWVAFDPEKHLRPKDDSGE